MKIYTVQHKDFIKNKDEFENIYLPENKKRFLETEEFGLVKPYLWMNKRFEKYKRTFEPNYCLQDNLIWVFTEPFPYGKVDKDYQLYVFEYPKRMLSKDFLWTDYMNWHYYLNDLEGWENVDIILKNPYKLTKYEVAQGVTDKINIKYLKGVYEIKGEQ